MLSRSKLGIELHDNLFKTAIIVRDLPFEIVACGDYQGTTTVLWTAT